MARYSELRDKVAIVTGAGSPGTIGEAIARAFAGEGARVVVVDINAEGGREVTEGIRAAGGDARFARVDVTDGDAVRAMVDDAIRDWGGVDILVNNAGGFSEVQTVADTDDARWRAMIELNLTSVFLCCKAVYAHMRERGSGRIINVSSVAGRASFPATSAYYSAAKAGVVSFTRSLAGELAPYGVTVNAVAPGATNTPRFMALRGEAAAEAMARRVPLGRLSTPEEQADVVLFLASDGARYMTGATLDVNGGTAML